MEQRNKENTKETNNDFLDKGKLDIEEVDINYLNSTSSFDWILWGMEFPAWKYLAITTCWFVVSVFSSFFRDSINPYLFFTLATVITVIVFLVIDFGLKDSIEHIVETLRGKDKSARSTFFFRTVFFVTAIRLLASATSSFWAAPELSQSLTEDGKEKFYITEISKKDSIRDVRFKRLNDLSTTLSSSERKRIKEAEKQGDLLISEAVSKGSTTWKQDYESQKNMPNAWFWKCKRGRACPQSYINYRNSILTAIKEKDKLVLAEKKKKQIADNNINNFHKDTTYNQVVSTLAYIGKSEKKSFVDKVINRSNLFILLDILAVIVAVASTTARTERRLRANLPKRNNTLAAIFDKLTAKKKRDFVNWIEEKLELSDDVFDEQKSAKKKVPKLDKINSFDKEPALLPKGTKPIKKRKKKRKKIIILEGVPFIVYNGQKLPKRECQKRLGVYKTLAKKQGDKITNNTLEKIKFWGDKVKELEEKEKVG